MGQAWEGWRLDCPSVAGSEQISLGDAAHTRRGDAASKMLSLRWAEFTASGGDGPRAFRSSRYIGSLRTPAIPKGSDVCDGSRGRESFQDIKGS